MHDKSVYIAYTGGTIGMRQSSQGFVPIPGNLLEAMERQPEFQSVHLPNITFREFNQIIDSSNATPALWNKIAEDILANYDHYDGFVILHGTDTMAYSASALSFILEGLNKAVIFTGSQIPFENVRSDARSNLIGAIQLAVDPRLHEVGVFFHNDLYRGNRSTKTDSSGFAAFESPNYPTLAKVGIDIRVNDRFIMGSTDQTLRIAPFKQDAEVGIVQIFPGMTGRLLHNYLSQPVKGVVLMTYGSGNIPSHDQLLVDEIRAACERGVIVVNCTQCMKGTVNMSTYATGSILMDAGVVNAGDMTIEASVTKLSWLISQYDDPVTIRELMATNLRGELGLEE
jgi:L-asparaginase